MFPSKHHQTPSWPQNLCLLKGNNHSGKKIRQFQRKTVLTVGASIPCHFLSFGLTLLPDAVGKLSWGVRSVFLSCLSLSPVLAVLLRIHAPTGWRHHTLRASLTRRKWLLEITDWREPAHVSVHFNGQSLERSLSGNTSVKWANNWTCRGTVKICVSLK